MSGLARTPGTTIAGLISIRAFDSTSDAVARAEGQLRSELDVNVSSEILFGVASRWLAIRLDFLVSLTACTIGLFAVLARDRPAGLRVHVLRLLTGVTVLALSLYRGVASHRIAGSHRCGGAVCVAGRMSFRSRPAGPALCSKEASFCTKLRVKGGVAFPPWRPVPCDVAGRISCRSRRR